MNQLQMPSKVTNKKFISMPQTEKVVESDEEWNRCGKWILSIGNADMEFLDKAWKDLQPLLADCTLIWLKASTAMLKHEGAHLHCFTGPGLEEIRRAASAIRQAVDFRGCMYYKPNKKTEEGISYRTGHKQIGTYMHTYLGRFFKKDGDRWIPDDEDDINNFSLSSQFYRENYSDPDPQPSKTPNRPIIKGKTKEGNSNWYLYCSCLKEDNLPPEIDRVWAVGTRLLSEGRIIGLSTCNDGSRGEVRLFVNRGSDFGSQLEVCDRIFREASIRGLMYYRRTKGRTSPNVLHCIKYTSDGELYRTNKFGDEFVKSIPSRVPDRNQL